MEKVECWEKPVKQYRVDFIYAILVTHTRPGGIKLNTLQRLRLKLPSYMALLYLLHESYLP